MLTNLENELEEVLKSYEQKELYSEALQGYQKIEENILQILNTLTNETHQSAYQLLAQCYLRQGNMYRSLGEPDKADECSKKEIEAAQKSGNNVTIAQSIFSEGVTLISNKQLHQGLQLLEKSREMFESGNSIDHKQGVGWYWIIKADLTNKGITDCSTDQVIEFANNALDHLLPIENWMGVSRAYQARAIAFKKIGQLTRADNELQKAKEAEGRIS
jgi:tetratricopeptide (TPR) repeat protein